MPKYRQGKQEFEKSATTVRGRELAARLGPALDRFLQLMDKCFVLSRANKKEEAIALYHAQGRPSMNELDKVLDDAVGFIDAQARHNTNLVISAAGFASTSAWDYAGPLLSRRRHADISHCSRNHQHTHSSGERPH